MKKKKKEREQEKKVQEEEEGVISPVDATLLLPFALYAVLIPVFKYRIEFVWSKIAVGYFCLGLGYLLFILLRRKLSVFIPRVAIPLSALVVMGGVSAVWAYNPYKVFHVAIMIMPGILAYALTILVLKGRREELVVLFSISGFVALYVAVYGILQWHEILYLPKNQYGLPDPISTFGLKNFTAEYLVIVLPAMISVFAVFSKIRSIMGICIAAVLYYILISYNRAGWLATIVIISSFIILWLFFKIKRGEFTGVLIKRFVIGLVGAGAVLTAALLFTQEGKRVTARFKSFVRATPTSSVTTRLLAWRGGLDMIKDNPIIGVGAANYEIFSWKYAPRLLDESTIFTNTRVDKAHNEYIQIFCDFGMLGMFLFLLTLFSIFSLYIDLFFKTNDWRDFWLSTGTFVGILACIAAASFTFNLQWPGSVTHFWYFVGLLEVLAGRGRRRHSISRFVPIIGLAGILACVVGFYYSRNFTLAEVHYRMGQFFKRAKKWDVAERHYLKSLEYESPAERTFYDLAYLYLGKEGNVGRTIKLLEEALKYVPYFGKGRRELGEFYLQTGRYKEAIKHLELALDSNPANTPEIYALIASTYSRLGDTENAIKYAKMSLEELKNVTLKKIMNAGKIKNMNYIVLGSEYAKKRVYGEAEKYLKEALKISDNPYAKINLAEVLINTDRESDAAKLLKDVEDKIETGKIGDRLKPFIWYNLAAAYAKMGSVNIALEYLERAMAKRPELKDRALRDPAFKNILHWK